MDAWKDFLPRWIKESYLSPASCWASGCVSSAPYTTLMAIRITKEDNCQSIRYTC